MADEAIRVEGLREFVRGLRRIDREFPKALRTGFKGAANLIVQTARPKVPTGPPQGGHAISSIKPSGAGGKVSVTEGGARFPYMPWLDFGGSVGPNRSVHRPFRKKGRYIWAAFSERHDEVLDAMNDAIRDTARAAGVEMEGE